MFLLLKLNGIVISYWRWNVQWRKFRDRVNNHDVNDDDIDKDGDEDDGHDNNYVDVKTNVKLGFP